MKKISVLLTLSIIISVFLGANTKVLALEPGDDFVKNIEIISVGKVYEGEKVSDILDRVTIEVTNWNDKIVSPENYKLGTEFDKTLKLSDDSIYIRCYMYGSRAGRSFDVPVTVLPNPNLQVQAPTTISVPINTNISKVESEINISTVGGEKIDGEIVWNDEKLNKEGTVTKSYTFVPTDKTYNEVNGEVTVKVNKLIKKTPAIKVAKKTKTTISLTKKSGCEYRIAGKKWQSSSTFKGLKANKKYTVYMRVKSTDTVKQGNVKKITVTTKK